MESLAREIINKDVRRNNKYQSVVDILVNGSLDGNSNETKIFQYIKDLIIFAAMVGKKYERKESVEKSDNTGITLGTFSGTGGGKGASVDQHNIIFMFGLLTHKDMKYMRDRNVDESIRLFEEYSNGGLALIKEWLIESSWNSLCLIDKILDELSKESEAGIDVRENPFN